MNRAFEMNSMENAKDVWLSNGLGVGLWYRFYSVDHVHSNSFRLRKSFFVRALRFVKIWHKTDQENHFSYLNPFDLVLSNSQSNFITNIVWLLHFDNSNLKNSLLFSGSKFSDIIRNLLHRYDFHASYLPSVVSFTWMRKFSRKYYS